MFFFTLHPVARKSRLSRSGKNCLFLWSTGRAKPLPQFSNKYLILRAHIFLFQCRLTPVLQALQQGFEKRELTWESVCLCSVPILLCSSAYLCSLESSKVKVIQQVMLNNTDLSGAGHEKTHILIIKFHFLFIFLLQIFFLKVPVTVLADRVSWLSM